MSDFECAEKILRDLVALGVRELVLCAGARNAPFVMVASRIDGLKTYSFFEERSAGFFALGRMQAEGNPVAVCTTSGTAVAELLPAVIEADYQNLPLVVLSADRPRSYRGTGAPQTIVQPGIFSAYVEKSWDLEGEVPPLSIGRRPIHINACFDDPKRYGLPFRNAVQSKIKVHTPIKRPMVIVGGLSVTEAPAVIEVLRSWGRPVYLEGVSQLRGCGRLKDFEILGGEAIFRSAEFDGVIRIGSVPTLRFWRDLALGEKPTIHFSQRPWSGLPGEHTVHSLEELTSFPADFEPWSVREREEDRSRFHKLEKILNEFPLSECGWVRRLSEWMPNHARVFLGNSLPIREWDLAARRDGEFQIFANRGVNGIDGLISTFIGAADENASNWGVIGDLSALYDMAGPWALRQRPIADLQLAVINNGGGKIFEKIFGDPLFENRHELEFSSVARLWNFNYQKLEGVNEKLKSGQGPQWLEIVPDPAQTAAFHRAWEAAQC